MSRFRAGRRRATDERGAFLALFAVLLLALLAAAALVVDLGQMRLMRRTNQSIADMAALAAGGRLSETAATPRDACGAAFAYVRANAPDLPPGASMSDPATGCAALPPSCIGAALPTAITHATATGAGPYEIVVSYPVLPSEIVNPAFPGGVGTRDGQACERMKVVVRKTQPSFFAGVIGAKSLSSSGTAVVRRQGGTTSQVPALWLLDPLECTSLAVTGGATLQVGIESAPVVPGLITIDSDGSACGGSYTVSVGGAGTRIRAVPQTGPAVGAISLFALPDSATACVGSACNPSDVTAGLIAPQPVSKQPARATRAPVDHRYNCKRGYPMYRTVVAIADCPYTATTPPYIDQLRAAVGSSGTPGFFTRISGGACNASGNVTYNGNVFVDCPTFRLSGSGPCSGPCVRFQGNVVFQGDVTITSGALEVNSLNATPTATGLPPECRLTMAGGCIRYSSQNAAFAYFRSGSLSVNGGKLLLKNVAVYQEAGSIKITGGAPPLWTGPSEGPLNALALWSGLKDGFTINGGGSLMLGGVFFTPEADFKITGGSPTDQFRAQFVSAKMSISGNGLLTMAPDPTQFVSLPPPAAYLVR